MLAERERMDKDLTIAQMQGRFRLVVLHETGHYMHEDDFKNTAAQFH
jgi:protein phosphatase methylesterase 1